MAITMVAPWRGRPGTESNRPATLKPMFLTTDQRRDSLAGRLACAA